ncbi:hypothetical protein PEC18_08445 [Paucibacter sp. O1-1]|uniref:hypothetical protein n=1 Tax=Paucibacter sp. M5-1 TaxID=3015998 RepID=UPI0021D4BA16|nr:hypothetical protein [Paucibacter sp. M5-1]MCU7370909.1 hypothetical protein [Paucibacter sp. O1-1]MCZ7881405.1 hypothetical protein [Paucibacter sp. M5-1]MDA3825896.1 hypothetical protein [Paucibacter sp. O1-1]
MKTALWIFIAFLAALWSGCAWLGIELLQWLAARLSAGDAGELERAIAQWPLPAWLEYWIDPAWAEMLRGALTGLMAAITHAAPWLGTAMGWLLPLAWVIWGGGLLALLALGALLNLLLNQARPTPAR